MVEGSLQGILAYSMLPSSDYISDTQFHCGRLATQVVDGNMIKVVAWYDNNGVIRENDLAVYILPSMSKESRMRVWR